MAKCGVTNICGGGGIGSDEMTATKDNVLSGKTYVGADTNDEIGTGSITDNGATGNQSINAGSSFLVKKGYHEQDFSVCANSLASQTPGTASANHLLSGQTAWVNGNKVNGSIASMGGQTITPGSTPLIISCSGRYMTGNITVPAVRKYGVINMTINSSSSISYFTGDFPGSLHYIEINPGFTPTCITAFLHLEGGDSSVYTNYGQFIVSAKNSPAKFSVRSTLTSNSLIIPVCSVGTYNLLVTGYY
ncbi:MAG: hypothetical protein E7248_01250 [Paenibacillaceae bacterium]|nr:hypothetical protein [Paenibacillaceae bacterium]